ncbi:MAG: PH domain-containing protein [Phycisphaerae bacterium]
MESTQAKSNRYKIIDLESGSSEPKLKKCIFCAEAIQADAFKCRFCGEFLNTDKARSLERLAKQKTEKDGPMPDENGILFAAKPSLFGLVGTGVKAAIILTLVMLAAKFPVEYYIMPFFGSIFNFQISDNQYHAITSYKNGLCLGAVMLIVFWLTYKVLKLKMTYYEISTDRIEYNRGVLDRKVDNIDMFRVADLKLRRSLLDCMLGIGEVTLITTDKSDPTFKFEKLRSSRKLYDIIKTQSLEADRKQQVVHIE